MPDPKRPQNKTMIRDLTEQVPEKNKHLDPVSNRTSTEMKKKKKME